MTHAKSRYFDSRETTRRLMRIILRPVSQSSIFDSTGRTLEKYLLYARSVLVRALLTDLTWCVHRWSPSVRPRNVRFVLCAIAKRTIATRSPAARSCQIADSPVQRSIDREQRSTHGVPVVYGRTSI